MSDFPPQDLRSFLEFCAGEWLSVRSSFDLEALPAEETEGGDGPDQAEGEAEESWHAARRGELAVAFLEPEREGEAGGLRVTPPQETGAAAPPQELHFEPGGTFRRRGAAGEVAQGSWRFWPDGSLELSQEGEQGEVRERIWFTKPNLRLRSSIEQRLDGRPARASFASEIRRVSRAAPSGSTGGG